METSRKINSTVPEIPGHPLDEIFLRLSSPQDLAHTSVVCVAFRGLFTAGSFLRRRHAPPLLGFLALDGFQPPPPRPPARPPPMHSPSPPTSPSLSFPSTTNGPSTTP
ncbi:hypothetical protein ZWY2020_000506 [Hordeum vulgare]|nr:hypothetical protein ZWY2020_000506 [Hordeum vulgare]